MSRKNSTNGGCSCESCRFTDAQTLSNWPVSDIDPAKLAKYLKAKSTGKMPADSAYSAHKAFAMRTPGREFSAAELASRSVRIYNAPAMKPDYVEIPTWGWKTTEDYIAAFDQKNSLKAVEYSFYWGETDMRSAV